MFLNVDMMLLPPRGYRQGCHRSPSWTVLPIVIGIVLGSHRYILFVCFGPSSMGRPFLIYGPSQLGLILILMSHSSCSRAEAMVSAMTFPALGRRAMSSMCTCSPLGLLYPPIFLQVRGVSHFPPCTFVLRRVCLLTALAFFLFSRSPFSLGALLAEDRPYLLRTIVMVPTPH